MARHNDALPQETYGQVAVLRERRLDRPSLPPDLLDPRWGNAKSHTGAFRRAPTSGVEVVTALKHPRASAEQGGSTQALALASSLSSSKMPVATRKPSIAAGTPA